MTKEEVKKYIKENLEIDSELSTPHESDNMVVSLRFKDEEPFTEATIFIPDN